MAKPKSLYLIDGHYQIYRAFYGAPQRLSSSTGEPTGAVHVFCSMLLKLLRERSPDYLAVVMDVSDETVFRRDIDAAYKAQRDPAPEALHVQIERIVSIVEALGIPIYRKQGFEADDVMATIGEQIKKKPIDLFLVSRDKDLEQLINERIRMFDPVKDLVVDAESLQELKGYTPAQAVEVQTLSGDTTDNIPGVPGIGLKTAAKLINQFGSADEVLKNADELTPKMKERVKAFADQLPITRQLVTLRRDVPMDFDIDTCRTEKFDVANALPILEELELRTLREQLAALAGGDGSATPPTAGDKGAPVAVQPDASRGTYELIDSAAKLKKLASSLTKAKAFAFDTETTGINPVAADLVGLSFSWESGQAVYVPVRCALGNPLPLADVVAALKPVLESDKQTKIAHNLKYDMLVLRQVGIKVAAPLFDTMIASFLLDPMRGSHGLDGLVRSRIGHEMIPISDLIGKGRNQITIDEVDVQRVCEYAAEDADFTYRLWEQLAPEMSGSHAERLFVDIEMPLVSVLTEMENNGVAIDEKLLARLSKKLAERMVELEAEIHEAAGHPFNVSSTQQLATVLFDEQGLTAVRKTKTGRSTDADTLQTLAAQSENPIPPLVLEYRELSKLKGTYVDTLPKMVCKRTGRIHASFHQTGAVTGRLSSSDPNLQNIPIRTETGKRIREAFVSGQADHVLLAADYSQIELRLLAHFSQDKALVEAFAQDLDIHRAVAAQVNGVELDDVTPTQRSAAKAVNFGIIYGQTAFGLSRTLSIPVGEAKAFIDMYFMRYPGIRMFIDKCIDDAKSRGYAETILGRRRPIPELHSRNRGQVGFGERIAVNTVVQGSAADLIKRAMIDIDLAIGAGRLPAAMLIQVHDELVFEVPESKIDEATAVIREKMTTAIPVSVPIVVDVAWGRNWAEGK